MAISDTLAMVGIVPPSQRLFIMYILSPVSALKPVSASKRLSWQYAYFTRGGLLAVVIGLGGCTNFAPKSIAPDINAAVPSEYNAPTAPGNYAPSRWWAEFQDPVLNGLLDKAIADNLDIAEASARLRAAEARARVSKSGLFPQINAGLNANRSDSPLSGTGFGAGLAGANGGADASTNEGAVDAAAPIIDAPTTGGPPSRLQFDNYSSSLAFSYELDIWGRLSNTARAGRADAIASAADLQAVRLAIMAETITSYFDIVDARHQIDLLKQIIDISADRVEQTENRYRRGLASSFELNQVRQDFRNLQASLPTRQKQLTNIEGQLAVLTGQYSQTLSPVLDQKLTPKLVFEPVPSGLAIDLLAQRPDIFAQGARLESARLNLGARKAERFPAINFTAATGTQAGAPSGVFNIFDNWVLNLGAGLSAPLFQGGRIRANIDVADAGYAQQTAVYARTVLNAYQEVESAIKGYDADRMRYRLLFAQWDEAIAASDLQSRRFASGVGNYIEYLDALRAQYQVQSALSSAGRDVALGRLAVHRALGGGWTENSINNADAENAENAENKGQD